MAAGTNQSRGESRRDLLTRNLAVTRAASAQIAQRAPRAVVLVVSNPVDALTSAALASTGFPPQRVLGSGTVLDIQRLRYMLSLHTGVDAARIHAIVLGEHGDSELPAWSAMSIAGMTLEAVSYTHLDVYKRQGLYSEIHPNDIAPAALKALPGIVGVSVNGGENRAVNGVPVEVDPAIYDLGLPILSVDCACTGHPADLPAWPENTRETLDAFIEGLGVERNWSMDSFIADQVELLRKQIGSRKVLLALSGGVDSSVVAALLLKAVGDQLTCVHVNHGLLRKGEPEQVVRVFKQEMGANLIYVDAVDRFLDKLAGVSDPEQKRKIIGAEFIRVFEE